MSHQRNYPCVEAAGICQDDLHRCLMFYVLFPDQSDRFARSAVASAVSAEISPRSQARRAEGSARYNIVEVVHGCVVEFTKIVRPIFPRLEKFPRYDD